MPAVIGHVTALGFLSSLRSDATHPPGYRAGLAEVVREAGRRTGSPRRPVRRQHRTPFRWHAALVEMADVHSVAIGSGPDAPVGALRFALGAPTVSDIVFGHHWAPSWQARLARAVDDVQLALEKIDLVVGSTTLTG